MLEVQRFLYLIFPYVFCTTISALIIWNEDWRKNGKQLLIYSVLAGITQTMSYQINNEAIRFPLEIVSGFLWMWIVFRRSFPWVAKIFTTSYVTGIPMVILSLIFCSYILGLTPSEVINNSRMWLGVTLPIFVLGTICIALVKRLWARKWNMTSFENIQGWAVVASALLLQLAVSMGLIWSLSAVRENNYWFIMASIGTIIIFTISLLIMVTYMKSLRKQAIISTHDAVSENVLELLNTLKAQQHDYINHLQVLSGLSQMRNLEGLQEYLNQLIFEVRSLDETTPIRNPILNALVNAKISQAEARGIKLNLDIQSGFEGIEYAAIDLSRILGNLINNAMDAVEGRPYRQEVDINMRDKGNDFVCEVQNPWTGDFPGQNKLFSPGFSTKQGEHSGLGLYICMQLAYRLRGELDCRYNPQEGVVFTISIPRLADAGAAEKEL